MSRFGRSCSGTQSRYSIEQSCSTRTVVIRTEYAIFALAILFRLHRFVSICANCSLHYVVYFSRVFKLSEHSRFINVANDVSFTAKANYRLLDREKLDSIVATLESVKIDDDSKISIKFSHRYDEKFELYATRRTLTRCLVSGDESGRAREGGRESAAWPWLVYVATQKGLGEEKGARSTARERARLRRGAFNAVGAPLRLSLPHPHSYRLLPSPHRPLLPLAPLPFGSLSSLAVCNEDELHVAPGVHAQRGQTKRV